MEKRHIVLPIGPDGKPLKIHLVARHSTVRPERMKCTFAADLEPGARFMSDDGEQGPKVDEAVAVMLVPEFRMEITQ